MEYINIRMVSIVETSEHAAKSYLSTLAVLQLDSILTGARKVSVKKPKPGNANQKPFERIMIMGKSISNEMLNFCPLCVAEVYALRCDAMRAGTSHYPLHRPSTTYYLCRKYMQFFLICKIHSKQLVHYGDSIFKISHFV